MPTGPSLSEIASEIEFLETFDSFVGELDAFTGRLSMLSGQDASVLSSDPTVVYELGQLRTLASQLSGTFAEADEILGKGPALAGQVQQVVHGLDAIVSYATTAQEASGPDRLRAMSDLLGNIESLASALTGLGGLNPVIGVFIGLYATALGSAANTAEFLEGVHAQTIETIKATDGKHDDADIAAMQATPPPDPAVLEARARARARLEQLYADHARARASADAAELGRARDHCARIHRDVLEEAVLEASRFGFQGHLDGDHPGINRHSMAALEAWLADPIEGVGEAMAAASQAGDDAAAARIAEQVRERLDSKARVGRLLTDYRDCVDDILEHGYRQGAGSAPVGAVAGAAATAMGTGPRRGLVAVAALAVVAGGAAAIALSAGGDGAPTSTTSPEDIGATEPAAAGAGAASAVADDRCAAAAEAPSSMELSSPAIPDGAPVPDEYRPSTEAGLISPPLEWSGSPEQATAFGIVVVGTQEPNHPVLTDPDPWRIGAEQGTAWSLDNRWRVTGIPAGTTSLPLMTYGEAVDMGLTLHAVGATATLPDRGDVTGWFRGPTTSTHTYLFTVFALCDPDMDSPRVGQNDWFVTESIAYATFGATTG